MLNKLVLQVPVTDGIYFLNNDWNVFFSYFSNPYGRPSRGSYRGNYKTDNRPRGW